METDALKAIQNILNAVCEIHKLPLALTWIKHRDFDDLYIGESASYMNDSSMQEYVLACLRNPLKRGQNVAGKAVNLMHQYTVPDVSLLDLANYPFVDLAKKFGLRAAMAVRLKCKSVGEIEYVVEVFLHKNMKDGVEQNNLINDILSSLRTKCENSGTVELQIQADPKLNLSKEVEASHIPSVAVSKSSFPNDGLNLEENIQNNWVETDEPHEQEVREQNATVELDVDGNKQRRKLVANVGDEREEEETSSASTNAIVMAEEQYPIVSGIGKAAVSGLAHDQVQELTVQEDYTAKETPEEVSRIRSIISYLAVLLSRYQLKLRVLATKPTTWPLMVLEEFLKLNAQICSLLQKMVIWVQAQLLLSQLLLVLQFF
ncbi:hypothetical protein NC651_010598 [Populus alba x Populus x berolinensis]|nr:hypothetical protein NC651_010598 [Populus alba x Populus x berolinensis]